MIEAMRLEGMWDLEVAALHQLCVGQDVCRVALCHEPATVEHQDAGAEIEDHLQVMTRQNAGILEVGELLDELAT